MTPTRHCGTQPLRRTLRLALLVVCLGLAPGSTLAADQFSASPPGILLLTSYNQGDPWNDRIVAGFLEALPVEQASVYVEYLDSRRLPGQPFLPELSALLARKYADASIRLLVGADDAALDFLLAHGNTLFPGRPIVFCGINDFSPSRLAGHDNVTGVTESPDMLGTVEMALDLLPGIDTVVAVGSDRSHASQANLARFRRAVLALGRRVKSQEILNRTLEQTQKALAELPRNTAVIRLDSLLSENGGEIPRGKEIGRLAVTTPVPLFVLRDYEIGDGALGGRVVCGRTQGQEAAKLASRILAGESPTGIPVAEVPSLSVVDDRVMARFDIPARLLPAGTLVKKPPDSLYERYKLLFWSVVIALAVLLPASVLLLLALANRNKAAVWLRESERRYRELVENTSCLILRYDKAGQLVFINAYAERLLGTTLEGLPELLAASRTAGPADLSGLLARAIVAPQTLEGNIAEYTILTPAGRKVIVSWDSRVLRDGAGACSGWLAVGTDITDRRVAEDALAARMLAEKELFAFSQELLSDAPESLDRALRRLLTVFSVDQAVLFENYHDTRLGLCFRLQAEALTPGQRTHLDNPVLTSVPYNIDSFRLAERLGASETVSGLAREFPLDMQEILSGYQVQSVMASPVFVNGVWSGFLAVGETRSERAFTRQEQIQLAMAASILSVHFSRPRLA